MTLLKHRAYSQSRSFSVCAVYTGREKKTCKMYM